MPCKSFIAAHFKAGGEFAGYTIHCSGTCDSGKQCEHQTRVRTEGKHTIHETWCGCDKTEPKTCHLVLRQTFEKGNPAAIRECVACVGDCPDEGGEARICELQVTPFRTSPETIKLPCADLNVPRDVWFRYECRCAQPPKVM